MFRLSNQSKLAEALKFESKLGSVFLKLEGYQLWKIATEIKDLDGLKEILSAEENLVNLINEELNK